jgi:hypothetical protein
LGELIMGAFIACAITGVIGFGAGALVGAAVIINMPLEQIAAMKEEINQRASRRQWQNNA